MLPSSILGLEHCPWELSVMGSDLCLPPPPDSSSHWLHVATERLPSVAEELDFEVYFS